MQKMSFFNAKAQRRKEVHLERIPLFLCASVPLC